MNIQSLLQEYALEIDDVRWYLASLQALRLLGYRDDPFALTRDIWSGSLEDELYEMEEGFLNQLQMDADRGIVDEAGIRVLLQEIDVERTKRYSNEP